MEGDLLETCIFPTKKKASAGGKSRGKALPEGFRQGWQLVTAQTGKKVRDPREEGRNRLLVVDASQWVIWPPASKKEPLPRAWNILMKRNKKKSHGNKREGLARQRGVCSWRSSYNRRFQLLEAKEGRKEDCE